MTVRDYIKERLSYEEYSFSWDELKINVKKTDIALKRELSRLVVKREIVNLRKGFYLIIPPKYSNQDYLPIQLYAEKLFKYLNKKYYLGFYTAAKFHGAGHQQIQRDYIISRPPAILDIKKKAIDLKFYTTTVWPEKNIMTKKSDAGIFKISSPVLTAADLIHNQSKLGGLNRIFTVIEELIEEITLPDMQDLLLWYPNLSTLQRLGYLLERSEADDKLIEKLFEHINSSRFFPVLLCPERGRKAGSVDNRWKVDVNIKLENDL
ncbi:MAG: type IV toxin-antitoxin system AbiEi family antitoxin [Spirochaetes bacterium]|nr:type IV toxin-antitoxin system AbiEi family antitoxin [Spirochaetota bacterium]